MKENKSQLTHYNKSNPMQTTMKLRRLAATVLLAFATALAVPALAQTTTGKTVTLSLQKAGVKQFFAEMKKQTGLDFICSAELARQLPLVTVSVKDVPAERVLSDVFTQLGCKYTIDGTIVTITHRDKSGRTRQIEGTVRDDQGEPLPGAVVRVKNGEAQTVTDNNGHYTIKAPTSACQLEYAYLGMLTHTADFAQGTADQRQNVRLVSDNQLSEVVVTGYQTISKERATGSYSIIKREDIESITFLKDAAAASIWGARSANGVIVITTKKTQKGLKKWNVEASTQLSISRKQNVAHLTNLSTAAQMINYQRWMFDNSMTSGGYARNMSNLFHSVTQSEVLFFEGMDWGTITADEMNRQLSVLAALDNRQQIKDNLLSNPLESKTNVAVSGGIGNWGTRFSAEFTHDKGDFIGSRDNTWKLDWQNNYRMNKWIALNVGVNLVNANRHSSAMGLGNISDLSPYEMLLNEDGTYATNYHSSYNSDLLLNSFDWSGFAYHNMNYNLLQEARERRQRTTNTQWRIQAGLEVDIIEGLRFNSRFQYESSRYKQRQTNSEESFYTRYQVNYYTPGDLLGNAQGVSALPTGAICIDGTK